MVWLLIPAWISYYTHTSLGMLLLIHTGIKVIRLVKEAPGAKKTDSLRFRDDIRVKGGIPYLGAMSNSHIRHSRAGRALLRSRKECRRLWVLLGSAVQVGPQTQSGMCIDPYQFLPEISSFVITCSCLFTADDNHLQKFTILSSVICRYTGHQQSLHQSKFYHFFLQIWSWNHMEVLRYRAAIV